MASVLMAGSGTCHRCESGQFPEVEQAGFSYHLPNYYSSLPAVERQKEPWQVRTIC